MVGWTSESKVPRWEIFIAERERSTTKTCNVCKMGIVCGGGRNGVLIPLFQSLVLHAALSEPHMLIGHSGTIEASISLTSLIVF